MSVALSTIGCPSRGIVVAGRQEEAASQHTQEENNSTDLAVPGECQNSSTDECSADQHADQYLQHRSRRHSHGLWMLALARCWPLHGARTNTVCFRPLPNPACPIAAHDAKRVKNNVVNVHDPDAENPLHDLHGDANCNG
jgi:hypothetical protein